MPEPQDFRELVFETLQYWAGGWEDDFGRVARDAYLSATRQPGSGCPAEWERVADRDRLVWVMVGAVVLEHAGRLLRAKVAAVDGKSLTDAEFHGRVTEFLYSMKPTARAVPPPFRCDPAAGVHQVQTDDDNRPVAPCPCGEIQPEGNRDD